jgi:2,4-dienoyl-CoA reductase-like NADH-dependent reductase (Old Yellow Enzyme family)
MSLLFSPFSLREVTLRNRVGMSPMCQYSCEARDGHASDWHGPHYAARAAGGCGLVIVEATAVEARGRISPQDLGLWQDAQIAPLAEVAQMIRAHGAVAGIQLAHAGRKAGTFRPWQGGGPLPQAEGWTPVAPNALPYNDDHRTPETLATRELPALVEAFAQAARRADAAGFDWLELHAAHGYLLHSFLSPITNQRTDTYGGSFDRRARLVCDVVEAVRAVWPADKPLTVRLSVTDWLDDGWRIEDSIALTRRLKPLGVDLIDCSSGGIRPKVSVPTGPGYHLPFAHAIREQTGVPTAAVGYITTPQQAEAALAQGKADVILLGRQLLREPYWPLRAAAELDGEAGALMPPQYRWALERG